MSDMNSQAFDSQALAEEALHKISTRRVTNRTPFFAVWSGAGFQSHLLGFETIEDARQAYKIVRDEPCLFQGGCVATHARIVQSGFDNQPNRVLFTGRIK